MLLLAVGAACTARSPRVAALVHVVDGIARFLAPVDKPLALSEAVARRLTRLVRVLIDRLADDPSMHFLDKRLRARRALAAAAFLGDVALMEQLYERFRCHIDAATVRSAVRGGSVDAFEWLRVRVAPRDDEQRRGHELAYSPYDLVEIFSPSVVALAAERGDLRMLAAVAHEYYSRLHQDCEPLLSKPLLFDQLLPLRAAARGGHDDAVEWLRAALGADSVSLEDDARMGPCGEAVESERRPCAHCLGTAAGRSARMKAEACAQWRMNHAAASGRLAAVRWFHEHRAAHGCTAAAMDLAATNGHLDVVRFLHERRTEGCTVAAMDGAAANGHLAVARFLRAHRSEGCSCRALEGAAGRGDQVMVEWLLQGDGSGDGGVAAATSAAVACAAARGHLAVAQLLCASLGDACGPEALVGAATGGHEPAARWLLACYGRRWGVAAVDRAAQAAAASGHAPLMRLLLAFAHDADPRDSPGRRRALVSALDAAAVGGHLRVAERLEARLGGAAPRRSALNKALVAAAKRADVAALEWTRARGAMARGWATLASCAAAFRGDLEVVQWFSLRYNGEAGGERENPPWGRRECIAQARRHRAALRWLQWSPDSVGPVE